MFSDRDQSGLTEHDQLHS